MASASSESVLRPLRNQNQYPYCQPDCSRCCGGSTCQPVRRPWTLTGPCQSSTAATIDHWPFKTISWCQRNCSPFYFMLLWSKFWISDVVYFFRWITMSPGVIPISGKPLTKPPWNTKRQMQKMQLRSCPQSLGLSPDSRF